jgi:hypothetical protein
MIVYSTQFRTGNKSIHPAILSEASCNRETVNINSFEEWCLLGCYAVWLCKNHTA